MTQTYNLVPRFCIGYFKNNWVSPWNFKMTAVFKIVASQGVTFRLVNQKRSPSDWGCEKVGVQWTAKL